MSRRSIGLNWVVPEGEIQINTDDGQGLDIATAI